MPSLCHSCQTPVDPLRTPARIVNARIVSYCGDCGRDPEAALERALRAAADASERAFEAVDADPIGRVSRFTGPRWLPTAVATGAIAASMLLWMVVAPRGAARQPLLAQLNAHAEAASASSMEPLEPKPLAAAGKQLPGGRLASFVHPLPGAGVALPTQSSRRFGADRDGQGKARGCGHGHCGVDIGERVGAPIVAVADGVVAKVVRFDNANGGMYVRVDHADDTSTFYFHLNAIRRDLKPGVSVKAGEAIAELGHTGILRSAPHLHFALAVREGTHDHYVDPEPYLRDAVLLAAPTSGDLSAMVRGSVAAPVTASVEAPGIAD
jgi:murein DD-endopeptidase MepM/ murein hydrolase activator NlpD